MYEISGSKNGKFRVCLPCIQRNPFDNLHQAMNGFFTCMMKSVLTGHF
jgi:hypothetical protein